MRLEQRKSPRLETRVGNKGLIAISKPPFLRVVMIARNIEHCCGVLCIQNVNKKIEVVIPRFLFDKYFLIICS